MSAVLTVVLTDEHSGGLTVASTEFVTAELKADMRAQRSAGSTAEMKVVRLVLSMVDMWASWLVELSVVRTDETKVDPSAAKMVVR